MNGKRSFTVSRVDGDDGPDTTHLITFELEAGEQDRLAELRGALEHAIEEGEVDEPGRYIVSTMDGDGDIVPYLFMVKRISSPEFKIVE